MGGDEGEKLGLQGNGTTVDAVEVGEEGVGGNGTEVKREGVEEMGGDRVEVEKHEDDQKGEGTMEVEQRRNESVVVTADQESKVETEAKNETVLVETDRNVEVLETLERTNGVGNNESLVILNESVITEGVSSEEKPHQLPQGEEKAGEETRENKTEVREGAAGEAREKEERDTDDGQVDEQEGEGHDEDDVEDEGGADDENPDDGPVEDTDGEEEDGDYDEDDEYDYDADGLDSMEEGEGVHTRDQPGAEGSSSVLVPKIVSIRPSGDSSERVIVSGTGFMRAMQCDITGPGTHGRSPAEKISDMEVVCLIPSEAKSKNGDFTIRLTNDGLSLSEPFHFEPRSLGATSTSSNRTAMLIAILIGDLFILYLVYKGYLYCIRPLLQQNEGFQSLPTRSRSTSPYVVQENGPFLR
uniref:IPT/TIG domain-containing protein n=1 Tax=Compsopogon caeruleus TaxID=31354 RepID=A0A7S1TCA9_9RHOD